MHILKEGRFRRTPKSPRDSGLSVAPGVPILGQGQCAKYRLVAKRPEEELDDAGAQSSQCIIREISIWLAHDQALYARDVVAC